MKKLFVSMFIAAAVFIAGSSFAADSASMTMYVTVTEAGAGIQLLFGPDYYFGSMTTSAARVNGTAGTEVRIFKNTGSANSSFQLSTGQWLDNTGTPLVTQWTYLTTDPTVPTGINQVRVGALWQTTVPPAVTDFLANDTVSTVPELSDSLDTYAQLATPADQKGAAVPSLGERTLSILLQTPASGSANLTSEVRSVLTVTSVLD